MDPLKLLLAAALVAVAFAPSASAAVFSLCPPHDPGALANACVQTGFGSTPGPSATLEPHHFCFGPPWCIVLLRPVVNPTGSSIPTVVVAGYAEATVACGKTPFCRVTLS